MDVAQGYRKVHGASPSQRLREERTCCARSCLQTDSFQLSGKSRYELIAQQASLGRCCAPEKWEQVSDVC